MSGRVCFDWVNTGRCARGNSCRFTHPVRGQSSNTRSGGGGGGGGGVRRQQGVCHDFQRTGTCRLGNRCRFSHNTSTSVTGANGPSQNTRRAAQQLKKDASLTKFIKHLSVAPKDKLGQELHKSRDLWRQCWQNEDLLDDPSRRMMLEVLARIPGSSAIEPPPIQLLTKITNGFLQKVGSTQDQDHVLTSVKTVRDVLLTVLQMEWDCTREEVVGGLTNIVVQAESKLLKQNKDHRTTGTELMGILEDLDRPWRIQLKENGDEFQDANETENTVEYSDWKAPTVEWLCTPEFFAPSSCPKMKVGKAGVYDSAEDYMDCSHRLWIAMTFSDGHASFAPHCRSRGNNGSCGSALWPVADSSHNQNVATLRCRTRRCDRPVEFSCRIKGHDSLCGDCARRSIENHCGGPGPDASTHIYDARVESIDPDGVIYMTQFKSRNPPPNQIHWRTTKRLAAPNLVGLVLLKSRGSSLAPTDLIKWAEVVNHRSGPRGGGEDLERQKGKIAVNASSIVELDPDYFERGASVAIIDCMCFVPEWIPVLRALDSQRHTKLPFENGRHLNLIKDSPVLPADTALSDSILASDTSSLIEEMIQTSQLEPIREVRRDDALKQLLSSKLERLVTSTTLDRMQLLSFVEALRNPVHLTQGPPGTGKSYLGVAIVRALIIIRDLWLQKSRSRGASPILVLSYKNHAIDEFLVDLSKAEPSLSASKMIRIGGQCKDNRLVSFSERANYNSDLEVQDARSIVDNLNNLRESIRFTMDDHLSSFRSYYHQIFFEKNDDESRKALVEATRVLMECLIRLDKMQAVSEKLAGNSSDEKSSKSPTDTYQLLDFLQVNGVGKSSNPIQRQMANPSSGSSLIPLLVLGASSTGAAEHWGDLLEKWLAGRVPLPRCTYSGDCRELAVSPDVKFCSRHLCYFSRGKDRCIQARRDDQTYFCATHACEVPDCGHQKVSDRQKYCKHHACWRCCELGKIAQLAEDDPPRNVCEDHPLCFLPGCNRSCQENSMYCSNHVNLTCQALTKRKKPCKGKAISALVPFCENHRHMTPVVVDEEENVIAATTYQPQEMPRCKATTKRGNLCKGARMPGSEYCFDHAPPGDQFKPKQDSVQTKASATSQSGSKKDEVPSTLSDEKSNMKITQKVEEDPNLKKDDEGNDTKDNVSVSSNGSYATAASHCKKTDSADMKALEADEAEIEEEEGDNLQHLREVFEVDSGGESDEESSVASNEENVGEQEPFTDTNEANFSGLTEPTEWHWDLSLEERWDASQALMEKLRGILSSAAVHVKFSVSVSRADLQQAKTRAKARVYENKTIIGGTMVGCISRLDSIRKTKPFAVVVEEASEVLEPLLFSCLSESTLKLEMIGDHRQLQPSVMSRYEFELCNKVNISMFQRLIEAPSGHEVSSTVLSIQRRMRKNICDLTRNFYADVTEIQDHETCGTQKIADRLSSSERAIVATSSTSGREVPGIGPHVFLWTHNGVQGRARVGVSRANTHEATMCCALACYLVECGVPRASIVCLTPYKGQLMLLRDTFFKDPRAKSLKLLSKDPREKDMIRLSTIDRFQGDEEDIVICSLVVDENSKTGFVKLVNRMVVLLSRARLGLYILGNTGYFESNGVPKHWGTTFETLQLPSENDSTSSSVEIASGARTGSSIPLCCPVHRDTATHAASPNALKLGFCKEPCQHKLMCGHYCSLDCHWPNKTHNTNCTVMLESNCQRHPAKITCNQAYSCAKNAPLKTSHDQIMSYYQCPKDVQMTLPCGHSIMKPCYLEKQIQDGLLSVPKCHKQSTTPYIFSSCGHELKVTCKKLEEFNANPMLIECQRDEAYSPTCGHIVSMPCHRKSRIQSGGEIFVCSHRVETTLPRCGHPRKLSCKDAEQLALWSGISCTEVGKVEEGVTYGDQDSVCTKHVTLHRKCGHKMKVTCNQAFARLTSLDPCQESVRTKHPSCGHAISLPCNQVVDLKEKGHTIPTALWSYLIGHVPPRNPIAGVPPCKELVEVKRKCGHIDKIPCSEVNKPLHGCKSVCSIKSPLCGHSIDVACYLQRDLSQPFWPSDIFNEICKDGLLPKEANPCRDVGTFDTESRKQLKGCKKTTKVVQSCGHEKIMQCSMLFDMLGKDVQNKATKCETLVTIKLQCGHKLNVECHQRNIALTRPCSSKKVVKCWNYSTCQHELEVPCAFDGIPSCTGDSSWTCPEGKHTWKMKQCSTGVPLDCAWCFLDNLSAQRSAPYPFEGKNELNHTLLRLPKECIEWIDAPVAEFLESEKKIVGQCYSYMEKAFETREDQILLNSSRVPCFRSLSKENSSWEKFDPKKCVKRDKSFHGIVSRHLTGENLKLLASKDANFTLLVGYASVVHTKVLPGRPPKKPKDKTQLAQGLSRDGYDSMSFVDENNHQCLLVLEPYPMIAVCRLKLTRDQLEVLSTYLDKVHPPDLSPKPVRWQPLSEQVTLFSTMKSPVNQAAISASGDGNESDNSGDDDDDEEESVDGESALEAINHLNGTEFDGLTLNLKWSGEVVFEENIPKSVESNLRNKMQFLNPAAPAFAGLQLIRTLLSDGNGESLNLLMAAESVPHSTSEAREYLDKYVHFVRANASTRKLHPWALLVSSRLVQESDAVKAKTMLVTFNHFFPLQDKYLTKNERELLRGMEKAEKDSTNVHSLLLQQWNDLKEKYPGEVNSQATDKLIALTGLRKVKEEAIRLWKTALQLKRMDEDARVENMINANYCFLGNPGTGKTTVARLLSKILCDMGVRSANTIQETTAQKVKDDGADKFRQLAASAMGGVLFIDEAYDLDPVGDSQGKPIVNELLTLCENDRDKISVILAGYEDEFQKKFFAYNDGLKSRFRELLFEDFDEKELASIWTEMRAKKKWSEEENVCSVIVKRIAKLAGKKGFGNARQVRNRLEEATQSALARLGQDFDQQDMVLKIEDVIGRDPRLSSEKLQRVVQEINEKIGWTRVKEKVKELIDLCGMNYERELLGKPPFQVVLNRMFLGSPGTGKTTGASLYGRLLKELGFLSNGDVVNKTASDFIGQHIGQSQKQTNQILEQARGKVLIIDEAYALNDNHFGKQVLDTLVEKVQGTSSDDIVVLLLGYEDEMLKMLREQNQGLTRRFPPEHAFYFDDYDENELLAILKLNLKLIGVEATLSFREKALDVLRVQKKRPNFGNAGAVDLLVKGAALKASKRMGSSETLKLEPLDIEDPGAARAEKDEDPLSQLDKLYRMEKVKAKLDKMRKDFEVARREGGEEPELGHFVFLGAPGTGKTSVARISADILYSLGLLGSSKIVETTGLDMTGEFLGQTKTKVEELLKEANGGVLFIDEAYNLGQGQFGKEACDTLVAAMTSDKYKGVLICIAGYPEEINKMLDANAGLKSRFSNYFQFPDWEVDDCVNYFKLVAEKEIFEVGSDVLDLVAEGCGRLRQLKGWGNGRDLLKLWKETKSNRSERVHSAPELEKQILLVDVQKALDSLIQARIGKLSDLPLNSNPLAELDSLFRMEEIKQKLQRLQKTWAVAKREGEGSPNLGHFVFSGAPGTGKTVTARAIARVLFALQLKPSDKLVETTGLDLQAQYLGQTAAKVNEKLGEAKGACLFIDEAYNLGSGQFGKEACDTLVAGMTSEDYKDVQIIIAGYPFEIDEMFKSNSGLKSRFTHFFEFPNWRPDDCVAFFQHRARKDDFGEVDSAILNCVGAGFEELVQLDGFANGRDVAALWSEAKRYRADRVYDEPEEKKTIRPEDVQEAIAMMLRSRRPKKPPKVATPHFSDEIAEVPGCVNSRAKGTTRFQTDEVEPTEIDSNDQGVQDTQTESATITSEEKEEAISEEVQEEQATIMSVDADCDDNDGASSDRSMSSTEDNGDCNAHNDPDERDDGVTDHVWEEVKAAKKREQQDERTLEALKAELDAAARQEETTRREHEREIKRLQEEKEQMERELARKDAEEAERRRLEKELQRLEKLEKQRREHEERHRRREERERRRREEVLRRIQEEKRKKEEIKKRLRIIGKCPVGFEWYRCGSVWRCGGGSHFVSNEELHRRFGSDV